MAATLAETERCTRTESNCSPSLRVRSGCVAEQPGPVAPRMKSLPLLRMHGPLSCYVDAPPRHLPMKCQRRRDRHGPTLTQQCVIAKDRHKGLSVEPAHFGPLGPPWARFGPPHATAACSWGDGPSRLLRLSRVGAHLQQALRRPGRESERWTQKTNANRLAALYSAPEAAATARRRHHNDATSALLTRPQMWMTNSVPSARPVVRPWPVVPVKPVSPSNTAELQRNHALGFSRGFEHIPTTPLPAHRITAYTPYPCSHPVPR